MNKSRRPLELDLLRSFAAIVAAGSFRAAAEAVGRSPSAVSMQIGRLEEIVGGRLFTRDRPPVRLTPEGEMLLDYARRLLVLEEEARAAFAPEAALGRVRFGIPDDYATGVLQPILARLAVEHPRIEVEITCAPSAQLLPLLKGGQLDLAIITHLPGRPRGQLVRREPLVWAAARISSGWDSDPLPVAVFQPDCWARDVVERALDKAKRRYRIAYASPNLAGLLAVVQAGLAVAALPRSSVPENLRLLDARLGFRRLPVLDLCLVRRERASSPAIDSMSACILAALA
ncbi:LysR substrate-binding domain-containing protein [Dongia mobilis]|nr:LysR substrate-binding domain-containing protein [Dongia mobilis]